MTVIIGFVGEDVVTMGCDCAASSLEDFWVESTPKIFHVIGRSDILVGCAGSFRLTNVLSNAENIFPAEVTQKSLILEFVPKLISLLENSKIDNIDDSEIMIACSNGLFVIQSDFAVLQPKRGWAAIGSGFSVANGVTAALLENSELSIIEVIDVAISITSRFVPSVSEDGYVIQLQS